MTTEPDSTENQRKCTVENCAPVSALHTRVTIFCWLVGAMIVTFIGSKAVGVLAFQKAEDNKEHISRVEKDVEELKDIKVMLTDIKDAVL